MAHRLRIGKGGATRSVYATPSWPSASGQHEHRRPWCSGTIGLAARILIHVAAAAAPTVVQPLPMPPAGPGAPRPSKNIFQRVKQDLLPDGTPNTAWRRLLIRINAATSLDTLRELWARHQPKTALWRPIHEAAVLTKAALLAYPTALMVPDVMMEPSVASPAAPPTDLAATAHAAVASHSRRASPMSSQSFSPPPYSAQTRQERWRSSLPVPMRDSDTQLQGLLDVVGARGPLTPPTLSFMNGATLTQLVVAPMRLGCHTPPRLLAALLGELYRDGGRKLHDLDVELLAHLASALLVIAPSSPHHEAVSLILPAPVALNLIAGGTAILPSHLPAGAHVRPDMRSPHVQPPPVESIPSFRAFLERYSDAPPPIQPLFGRQHISTNSIKDNTTRPRPAAALDAHALWAGVTRRATALAVGRDGRPRQLPRTPTCSLAASLAHVGRLDTQILEALLAAMGAAVRVRHRVHPAAASVPGHAIALGLLDWSESIDRGSIGVDVGVPVEPQLSEATKSPNRSGGTSVTHEEADWLPWSPRALSDLLVALALAHGDDRDGHGGSSGSGGGRLLQFGDSDEFLGSATQRLGTLLHEATLDDICRASWGLARLYTLHGRHELMCLQEQQRTVDAFNVVSSAIQEARYRWTADHLACMCESWVALNHSCDATQDLLVYLAALPARQTRLIARTSGIGLGDGDVSGSRGRYGGGGGGGSSSGVMNQQLLSITRLARALLVIARIIQQHGSQTGRRGRKPQPQQQQQQRRAQLSSAVAYPGDTHKRLHAALQQSLSVVAIAMAVRMCASGAPLQATPSDVATLLQTVACARQLGVVNVARSVPPTTLLEVCSGSHADPKSFQDDSELLAALETATLQLVTSGALHKDTVGGANLGIAWRVAGRNDMAERVLSAMVSHAMSVPM